MDQRSKCEKENYKALKNNIGINLPDIGVSSSFSQIGNLSTSNKRKIDKLDFIVLQVSEKAIH